MTVQKDRLKTYPNCVPDSTVFYISLAATHGSLGKTELLTEDPNNVDKTTLANSRKEDGVEDNLCFIRRRR